jgi:acyl carrier protein
MTSPSLEIVRRIAVETLNVPDNRLRTSATLQEAGIDSLGATDLVFAIEGHFGITIAPNDLPKLQSLSDLAACVDRLTAHEARRYVE